MKTQKERVDALKEILKLELVGNTSKIKKGLHHFLVKGRHRDDSEKYH